MITQTISLNLVPDQAPVVVHVSQYDVGNNRLIVKLMDGDSAYTPPSGARATIQGTKPDRFGFQYNCTLSGSTVTANITEQMTAVAGRYPANIIIYEGTSQKIGTFNFWFDVQKAALGDDTVISDSAGNIYNIPILVSEAQTAAANASSSAGQAAASAASTAQIASDSEAWAVGNRGGTPVPSTDPAYHNNAKYYADMTGELTVKVNATQADIAYVEPSSTATKNHAVGGYLIYNNYLYKVTQAIPLGGTITVGTNVEAVTVMDVVAAAGVSDMTGATATVAGTHGLAPAPAAGSQEKYLRGDGSWSKVSTGEIDGISNYYTKTEVNTITNVLPTLVVTTAAFSSLPQTISNANITADMVVVNSTLSNPSAQLGDWTVDTADGSLTINGSISGSTTITLFLMKSR